MRWAILPLSATASVASLLPVGPCFFLMTPQQLSRGSTLSVRGVAREAHAMVPHQRWPMKQSGEKAVLRSVTAFKRPAMLKARGDRDAEGGDEREGTPRDPGMERTSRERQA
jgi:hypothetical protein